MQKSGSPPHRTLSPISSSAPIRRILLTNTLKKRRRFYVLEKTNHQENDSSGSEADFANLIGILYSTLRIVLK